MKPLYLLLLVTALFTACTKRSNQDPVPNFGPGCVTRIYTNTKVNLSAIKQAKLDSLIAVNNIPARPYLHPYRLIDEYVTTPGTLMPHITSVAFYQYANNQLLFTNDVIYGFNNNALTFTSGTLFNGKIALDTVPALDVQKLRNIYLSQAGPGGLYSQAALKDSCLVAQFGYYDLNAGTSFTTPGNFVKAWKISTKGGLPEAYVMDNGKLIYYFNGIMTL